MIANGQTLLNLKPIKNMASGKTHEHGVTSGLGEAGYDIRIKQTVTFEPGRQGKMFCWVEDMNRDKNNPFLYSENSGKYSRFTLASAMEEFHMPECLVGIVHDKSSWARKGLSVFNTVIEPGWKGFLTLELVYHGDEKLVIPAGAGIAQVVFHMTSDLAAYEGKYQNQEDKPVAARESRAAAFEEGAPNGLYCPTCKSPQFMTSSGATCQFGHGGEEGTPL